VIAKFGLSYAVASYAYRDGYPIDKVSRSRCGASPFGLVPFIDQV